MLSLLFDNCSQNYKTYKIKQFYRKTHPKQHNQNDMNLFAHALDLSYEY